MVSHSLLEGRPLTTRAGWLNPIIVAQLRIACRLIKPKPVDKPIFILGTGRSGTTILGDLLGSHRHVALLNEAKALWYVANPLDDIVGTYTQQHGKYRLSSDDASRETRERIQSLYRYALGLCRASRIVDKYPEMMFRVDFLQALFSEPRFIAIIRDGWDTISSIEEWSRDHRLTRGEDIHDWWGLNRRKWRLLQRDVISGDRQLSQAIASAGTALSDRALAAVEWIATMREAERLMLRGVELKIVRYEELTSDPDSVLAAICDFTGLPPDEKQYEFARHTLRNRRARTRPDLVEPLAELVRQTMHQWGYPLVGS